MDRGVEEILSKAERLAVSLREFVPIGIAFSIINRSKQAGWGNEKWGESKWGD